MKSKIVRIGSILLIIIGLIFFIQINKKNQKVTKVLYHQETAEIQIPETYELSNIILAMTDYGISDEWEVQKNSDYYKAVLQYFEPVKDHPLLEKVNYSREKWDYYLAFRTDAIAYSFNEMNKLEKDFKFSTQRGLDPFGKNISLINDFVEKSNFREFYTQNKTFYEALICNYKDYNFVNEMIEFLDYRIGKSIKQSQAQRYIIFLSPLVCRMNCHRELSKDIIADFPSMTEGFMKFNNDDENIEDRLNSNHLIFTEKAHEYINSITDKYIDLVNSNFSTKYWDKQSGYEGSNSFNEYMTWAVYDLFLEDKFPDYAQKTSTFWQYQNASRGFFAQNLFSDKVKSLYHKNNGCKFENIYEPLLEWTKEIENDISLPTLVNINTEDFIEIDSNDVQLNFSESMNTTEPFGIEIRELKDGKLTGNNKYLMITEYRWTKEGKTVNFIIDTDYKEFALVLNWWKIEKPLVSKKGVFLKTSSQVLLKKTEYSCNS